MKRAIIVGVTPQDLARVVRSGEVAGRWAMARYSQFVGYTATVCYAPDLSQAGWYWSEAFDACFPGPVAVHPGREFSAQLIKCRGTRVQARRIIAEEVEDRRLAFILCQNWLKKDMLKALMHGTGFSSHQLSYGTGHWIMVDFEEKQVRQIAPTMPPLPIVAAAA